MREGTVPNYDRGDSSRERRRSLLGWLRVRRGEADGPHREDEFESESQAPVPAMPEPAIAAPLPRVREPVREPRHVRAVPSSVEHKVASAIEVFNGSEHARTIAGVARSLGSPWVSVRASEVYPSVVKVVASWELCWYRYEIDLADELPSVRVSAQGSELEELDSEERAANAGADENGLLALRQ